jgi:DNA-directed RNA polymerase specialized sigma24 family protein
MMKAQQGYSFDEISQVMGVTRPVVKNRYYAVVKKMRKELQDYE